MSLFENPPLHDFPDRALRQALAHPQNLRDLLTAALPDLAPRLDFEHVEEVKRDFLLEDWRGREADLFFRIPYRPEGAEEAEQILVCVQMEHQSQPDPRLPLRLLLHALLYWEQEWKEWERSHSLGESLRLTPIIPVVFHTGPKPWSSNRTLAELIGGPPEIQRLAPSWPVTFWDLAEHSAEELLAEEGPFLHLLSMVRVEKEEAERFSEVFGQLMTRLGLVADRDKMRWRDLLWLALSWVLQRRHESEREALLKLAQDAQAEQRLREEVSDVTQSTQITWIQRVEFETTLRALRGAVRTVLTSRFNSIPEELERRLQGCDDPDRLQTAIQQAVTTPSLDAFQF